MWRLVLALGACGPVPVWKDSDSAPADDSQPPDPSECKGLTWKGVGYPFVQTWCIECHSVAVKGDDRNDAPVSVNFDTYDLVAAQADLIDLVLDRENPIMPPDGGPSAKDIETLLLWLDCGAPQ